MLSPIILATTYIPTRGVKGVPFPLLSAALLLAGLLDEGRSEQNEGRLHFRLSISLSLITGDVQHLFTCPMAAWLPFQKKYPCQSLPQFFSLPWVVCVFDIQMHQLFASFGDE